MYGITEEIYKSLDFELSESTSKSALEIFCDYYSFVNKKSSAIDAKDEDSQDVKLGKSSIVPISDVDVPKKCDSAIRNSKSFMFNSTNDINKMTRAMQEVDMDNELQKQYMWAMIKFDIQKLSEMLAKNEYLMYLRDPIKGVIFEN
ncbi:MAG: hypothetical protein MHMPM18_003643 [Marteilia pararefringens]